MFVNIKFHLHNKSQRCTIPKTVSVDDLKKQAESLFPQLLGKTFYLEVATPSKNVQLKSDLQWLHTAHQIAPGLIHIQITFQPLAEENTTNKKLISPERKITLPLRNKIKDGEAVSMYGRMQSMEDEDVRWSFDLCGNAENNIILRIEFIKNANHVGWTQFSQIINGKTETKTDYVGPFPFIPDEFFHFVVLFNDNTASIQFSNQRCAVPQIPLHPFESTNIDTVVLSSIQGRIICSSIFHSYSIL